MKYIILFIFITQVSHAKWRPLTFEELLKSTDAIVIASYVNGKDISKKSHTTSQLNQFKLLKSLKGNMTKEFLVRGRKTDLCVPQVYFKDVKEHKFLLFLSKSKKQYYRILNGNFGALKIEDKKVPWFIEGKPHSFQREPKSLKLVLTEIKNKLKKLSLSKKNK